MRFCRGRIVPPCSLMRLDRGINPDAFFVQVAAGQAGWAI
jgi:hypothetical protein